MRVILCLVSYCLGSIPVGLIIGFSVKKTDIRKHGSGNIGATNVSRVIGKGWGKIVFLCDFLKGFLPVVTIFLLFPQMPLYVLVLAALSAVIGHNWSMFLRFRGGKGVSTSIGVMTALCFVYPKVLIALIVALVTWAAIFSIFRYVSLASLTAAAAFFLISLLILDREFKIFALVILVMIVVRHKKNISNLLHRKELKV